MKWPVYPKWSIGHWVQIAAAAGAIILVVITISAMVTAESQPHVRPVRVLELAFAWAFFPPVWAWAEFFFILPKWGNQAASETLREGQKVALAIWAAIAIALAAYGSSDYFKPEPKCASGANSVPAQVGHAAPR